MRSKFFCLIVGLFVCGCAAPTEEMQRLKVENTQLKTDLQTATADLSKLEKKNDDLTGKVNELNRISGTLEREKKVRVEETSLLRQNVRSFVRNQLTVLRDFSKGEGFLDYRGGELIQRSGNPGESLSLIDTQYQMYADGALYGVRGQFKRQAEFRLAVLRAIKNKWIVVWKTGKIEVEKPGLQQIDFPAPVSVKKDDLIAYLFPKKIPVACDQGTGGILAVKAQLEPGQKLTQATVDPREGWSCSVGVVGMLGD